MPKRLDRSSTRISPIPNSGVIMHKVFVYGTLLSSASNPAKSFAEATIISKGHVIGRLYDLGWYPGYRPEARMDLPEPSKVYGELVEVSDGNLEKLDSYEGYPSLYDRQKVFVHTEDGLEEAWVYVYNHKDDLTQDQIIPSGSWLERVEECA